VQYVGQLAGPDKRAASGQSPTSTRESLDEELGQSIALAAAHDQDGVAGANLAGQPGRGLLHAARRFWRSNRPPAGVASARAAAEVIVVSWSRLDQMSAMATASAVARTSANASSIAAVR